MTRLAALLLIAPALLAAQEPRDSVMPPARRGLVAGVTGFTGGTWQPSGLEIGVLRSLGTARYVSAMVRLGSFVQDQAVLIGGSQGFFVTALLGVRRPVANLAMVGTDRDPSWVRLVAAPELGVSAGIDSPLPEGGYWGTGALLFGLSFGGDQRIDENFAILAGPAVFAGKAGANLHVQVSLRYQTSSGGTRRRGPPD